MSTAITGLIVGALTSLSIGVAMPAIAVPRQLLASGLLAGAIITAAWYLP